MLTSTPLVVDLDGTLICTDTFHEMMVCLLYTHPWKLVLIPWWLLTKGRAFTKMRLMDLTPLAPALLPYNRPFLEFVRKEASQGRYLVLATGTPQVLAEKIATHLGGIQEVIGTTETLNMVGKNKKKALVDRFGPQGFDYAGDSLKDVYVWEAARKGLLVHPKHRVFKRTCSLLYPRKSETFFSHFPRAQPRYLSLFFALRLLFWPLSFCLFPFKAQIISACLLTSGAFICGDLLRIRKERAESLSPSLFAKGYLQLTTAFVLGPTLLLLAFIGWPSLLLYCPFLIIADLLTRSLPPSVRWAFLSVFHLSVLCFFFR